MKLSSLYFLGIFGGVKPCSGAWQHAMNVLSTEEEEQAGTVRSAVLEKSVSISFYWILCSSAYQPFHLG